MQWGILAVVIFGLLLIYVVVQGTMAHLKWRQMAAQGDVEIIRQLLQGQMEAWREMRVPKDTDPHVWLEVQMAELVAVGPDYARVSCTAAGQYALVEGSRREVTSPLAEGMKLTAKLADLLLYDIPNLKLDRAQIDVYTTFRDQEGAAYQPCILSTIASRSQAAGLDWESLAAQEIVDRLGGRYRLGPGGAPLAIEPLAGVEVSSS